MLTQMLADERPGALGRLFDGGYEKSLTVEEIAPLVDRLCETVNEFAGLMNVRLPGELTCSDLEWAAHNQAADIVSDEHSGAWLESEAVLTALKSTTGDLNNSAQACADHRWSRTPDSQEPISTKFPSDESLAQTPDELGKRHVVAGRPSFSWIESQTSADLIHELEQTLATCRQDRSALTLFFLESDQIHVVPTNIRNQVSLELERKIREFPHAVRQGCISQIAKTRLAVILLGLDRHLSVDFARQLVDGLQPIFIHSLEPTSNAAAMSVGVATANVPSKSLSGAQMVEAAERCLFASQSSGGNMVKSIDMY